jgi:hypothetical protein
MAARREAGGAIPPALSYSRDHAAVHHEGTKATKDSSARSTSSHAASEELGGNRADQEVDPATTVDPKAIGGAGAISGAAA